MTEVMMDGEDQSEFDTFQLHFVVFDILWFFLLLLFVFLNKVQGESWSHFLILIITESSYSTPSYSVTFRLVGYSSNGLVTSDIAWADITQLPLETAKVLIVLFWMSFAFENRDCKPLF